ncbi:MAG: DUF6770 family protein, partial [Bacteroidota bacterium]
MKLKFLFIFSFFVVTLQAQIADLGKLSKGRMYSSDVIKDSKNNIKGYFLLFESDKVGKETYELQYVVLDENLTKVTDGYITEMKFESWLVDAQGVDVAVSLNKNKLLLRFADDFQGTLAFHRYRTLDIKNNKISDPFVFINDSLKINPVFDRKMSNMENNQSNPIMYFDGVGMIVQSYGMKKKKIMTKSFVHYDDDMKRLWEYEYYDREKVDKTYANLNYVASDDDVIVMFKHLSKKNDDYINDVSALFLNSDKGTVRNEFGFPELDKYTYRVVDCKLGEDKIYIMGNYAEKQKYGYVNDHDGLGIYTFIFDKATGKLIDKKYITWESMNKALPINKNGLVKKEGYMYVHNMLYQPNGKVIVIGETFENAPITTNNMYFFELSADFKLEQTFEVSKFRNKFPQTTAYSGDIKNYGLFDFIDYQDLGDGEYLFLLNDNEKKSKNRKKSTLYGIVHY